MQILSHRGFWKKVEEKNAMPAFKNAFEEGFGVETDIRDSNSELVISHDLPTGTELSFLNFIDFAKKYECFLALNIKSDGLADFLRNEMQKYPKEKWMVFDMSAPDMIQHIKVGNPVFTRVSDIEPNPICFNECQGIWLDAFYNDWFTSKEVEMYLRAGKKVCIVSSELHKRNHSNLWRSLKENNLYKEENLLLCTDYPDKAQIFFNND